MDMKLILQAKAGDLNARDTLIMDNKKYIYSLIKRFKYDYHTSTQEDLFQIGVMAFIRAIDKFDPDRGFKLTTLLFYVIRDHFIKYSRNLDPIVRRGQRNKPERTQCIVNDIPYVDNEYDFKEWLDKLKPYLRKIIELRYYEGLTFKEIGVRIGRTKQRCEQLHRQALGCLRESLHE